MNSLIKASVIMQWKIKLKFLNDKNLRYFFKRQKMIKKDEIDDNKEQNSAVQMFDFEQDF